MSLPTANVKVAVRVRPLIQRELDANETACWSVRDDSIFSEKDGKIASVFTFDHVFDQATSNTQIYEAYCHPIVDAAMRGFNGTIFAYGQTSSGKTHTMFGSDNERGLVQLTVEDVFNIIENVPDREYLLRISYLEIYKENLYDLLDKTKSSSLVIREMDGQPFVANLSEVTVSSPEAILSTMQTGEKLRHFGETDMNQRSSRSHTIFRMIIESSIREDDSEGVVTVSHLNLVDLAGSERAEQSGTSGSRFKEGVHINSSLSVLGQVISKLSRGERGHINYRDSKLTRILKNSLGGNAHTAIICNVTPASVDQTLCTLRFASSAKKIQNKPVVNEVISDSAALRRYHKQMQDLQEKIRQLEDQSLSKKLQEKNSTIEELQQKVKELREQLVVSTHAAPPKLEHEKFRKQRRETWAAPRRVVPAHSLVRQDERVALSPVKEDPEMMDSNPASPVTFQRRSQKSAVISDLPNIPVPDFRGINRTDFEKHLKEEEKRRISEADSDILISACAQVCQNTSCQEKIDSLEREVAMLSKELYDLREMTTLERLCCQTSRKRRRTDSPGRQYDFTASPCLMEQWSEVPDITKTSCGLMSTSSVPEDSASTDTLKYYDPLCPIHVETADKAVSTNLIFTPLKKECRDFSAMTSFASSGIDKEERCVESVGVLTLDVTVERNSVATQTDRVETADVFIGVDIRSHTSDKIIATDCLRSSMVDVSVSTESAAIPQIEVKDASTETEAVKTVDCAITAFVIDAPRCCTRDAATSMGMVKTVDCGVTASISPITSNKHTLTEVVETLKAEVRETASQTASVRTSDVSVTALLLPAAYDRGVMTDAMTSATKDALCQTTPGPSSPSSQIICSNSDRSTEFQSKTTAGSWKALETSTPTIGVSQPTSPVTTAATFSSEKRTSPFANLLLTPSESYAIHMERSRQKLRVSSSKSTIEPLSNIKCGGATDGELNPVPKLHASTVPAVLSKRFETLSNLAKNCPLLPEFGPVMKPVCHEKCVQTDSNGVEDSSQHIYRVEQLNERIRSMEKKHRRKEIELQSEIRRLQNANPDNSVILQDSSSSHNGGGRQNPLEPMSPGHREEALAMEVAKVLSGPSIGNDMIIEQLRSQLNYKTMKLKKLERKVALLTPHRKVEAKLLTTKDAATSPKDSSSREMMSKLQSAKDAPTSPSDKENSPVHTRGPAASSRSGHAPWKCPPPPMNPEECNPQ